MTIFKKRLRISIIQFLLLFGVIHFGYKIYEGKKQISYLKQTLIKTSGNIQHTWKTIHTDSDGHQQTKTFAIVGFTDTNNIERKFSVEVTRKNYLDETVTVYHNNTNIARLFLAQGDLQEILLPSIFTLFSFLFFMFYSIFPKKIRNMKSFNYKKFIPIYIFIILSITVGGIIINEINNPSEYKNLTASTTGTITDINYINTFKAPPRAKISFKIKNENFSTYSNSLGLTKSKVIVLYDPLKNENFTVVSSQDIGEYKYYIIIFIGLFFLLLLSFSTPLGNHLKKYNII